MSEVSSFVMPAGRRPASIIVLLMGPGLRIAGVTALAMFLVGCASNAPDVRRLSPVAEVSIVPSRCKIVSLLKDSPAEKAGLRLGDEIAGINGTAPRDAEAVADLVAKSGADMDADLIRQDGKTEHLQIHLNTKKPRLGAVCDLSGWRKPGVTSAGNESVTVFEGPFAFTGSGIIDKGLVFMRVRLANNSDHPLKVSPDLFSAVDGNQAVLAILSPHQVMCDLYGEKGAQLLVLKKSRKDTLDTDNAPKEEPAAETACPGGAATGRLSGGSAEYAQANADYVASESLWPITLPPGGTVDGLIYLKEPAALPVMIKASIETYAMSARFGLPQPEAKVMQGDDLAKFFGAEKKGTPIRLTLKRGKVFVGKFNSYDSDNEKVWFDTPSSGIFPATSFPLDTIRTAEEMELVPPKFQPVSEQAN